MALTYHDNGSNGIVVCTHYDLSRINKTAEFAKKMHNYGNHGTKDRKVIASVDPAIIHRYCNMRGIAIADFMNDQKELNAFLENPDNANFRIWKGKL